MAGELGATVIVQKEVTMPIPCSPIDRRHVNGAMRMHKRPALLDDFPFTSPGDTGESSDEPLKWQNSPIDSGVDLRSTLNQHVRSSPQPIIRDFPYGQAPRVRSHGSCIKTDPPSPLMTVSRSDADNEVDDDAAFAFDLDIDSIVKSISKVSVSPITTDQTHFARTNHPPRPPKQTKHKVPHVPLDPVAKALHRRARRDAKRQQKRKELGLAPELLSTTPVPTIKRTKPKIVVGTVEKGSGDDSPIVSRQFKGLKKSSQVFDAEDFLGDLTPFDPLAPRFIAEALVVRKFTLEESLLELDTLSFDP